MKKVILAYCTITLGLFLSACNYNADIWGDLNRRIDNGPSEIGAVTWSIDAVAGQYIRISFNEPMNASSISTSSIIIAVGETAIDGTWEYDDVNMTATFTPTSPVRLPRGADHVVRITTLVQDASFNNLSASYEYPFTTPEALAVVEAGISPQDEESNIPPNAPITIPFNQDVDASSINGTMAIAVLDGSVDVSGDWSYNDATRTATFIPVSYPRGQYITVEVTGDVYDAYGYPFEPDDASSFNFTALALIWVESIVPENWTTDVGPYDTIQVTFSHPVDAMSIDTTTMRVRNGAVEITGTWVYTATSRTAEFIHDSDPFPRNETINVEVLSGGVFDQYGAPIDTDYPSSFYVKDYATVTATTPVNGAGGINISVPVSITFSEPMDPASGWQLQVAEIIVGVPVVVHTIDNTTPGITWSSDNTMLSIGDVHHSYGEPGIERPYRLLLSGFSASLDGSTLYTTGSYSSDYSVRSSWEDVAGTPSVNVVTTPLRPISLIQAGTSLHLAVLEPNGGTNTLTTYTYNGSTWQQNNAGFTTSSVSNVDLVVSQGSLHVAYTNTAGRGVVMRMNDVDDWQYLGFDAGPIYLIGDRISLGEVSDIRVADDKGNLYAAFEQTELVGSGVDAGESTGVYLMSWNGSNWVYAGRPDDITSNDVNSVSLKVHDNRLFVGYSWSGFINYKVYDPAGPPYWVSDKNKDHVYPTSCSDMSFVYGYPLFVSHVYHPTYGYCYLFECDLGASWKMYPEPEGGADIFETTMIRSSLYVDADDTGMPYFVYKEPMPSVGDLKLHIKYAENPDPVNATAWVTPPEWDIISTGAGDAPSVAILNKVIYVAYLDNNNSGKLVVRRHY